LSSFHSDLSADKLKQAKADAAAQPPDKTKNIKVRFALF
jgi:hypothetical protein